METHAAGFTPPISLPGDNTNLPSVGKKTSPPPAPGPRKLFQERDSSHLPANNVIEGSKFNISSFAAPPSHTAQQKNKISDGFVRKEDSNHIPSKVLIKPLALKLPSFAAPSPSPKGNRDS